jgi:low temperature requirement protein LtrA
VNTNPEAEDAQWIEAPALNETEAEHGHRQASWLELFFDLVFVAAVGQLSHTLAEDVTWKSVLHYGLLFIPVWWAWVGFTFYADRFDTDDLSDRLLALVQMGATAVLAVNIPHALDDRMVPFALAYAALRASLMAQYLLAGHHIRKARPLTRRFWRGSAAAGALWAISAFVPVPYAFGFWIAGLAVDFLTQLGAGKIHGEVAPSTGHLPERFGLFTLIVLGEAIVAVVSGIGDQAWTVATVTTAMLSLVLAFAIWWIYFENLGGATIRSASEEGRTGAYQLWLYAHLPLTASIAAAAMGAHHALRSPVGEAFPAAHRWLMCGSIALCLVSLALIHLSDALATGVRWLNRQAVWRLTGAAAAIATAIFGAGLGAVWIVAIVTVIGSLQIITDPPHWRQNSPALSGDDEPTGTGD